MPITIQKTDPIPQPNTVIAPQIVLQSSIHNGELITSATITLQGAVADQKGKFVRSVGETVSTYIPNIMSPEEDLKSVVPQIQQIFSGIVSTIDSINQIRKII